MALGGFEHLSRSPTLSMMAILSLDDIGTLLPINT